MKILALEASSSLVSLAIREDGQLIATHRFSAPRGRGAEIFTALEKLRPAWKDADRLAIGVGPGSYNGLRTTCALAQSFALVLSCELVTCPSPCLLEVPEDRYLAVGDARGGRLWCAEVAGRKLHTEIALITPEELAAKLSSSTATPVYRVGSAPGADHLPATVPAAEVLSALAPRLTPLASGKPEPIYLKPPHITLPRTTGGGLPAGAATC